MFYAAAAFFNYYSKKGAAAPVTEISSFCDSSFRPAAEQADPIGIDYLIPLNSFIASTIAAMFSTGVFAWMQWMLFAT